MWLMRFVCIVDVNKEYKEFNVMTSKEFLHFVIFGLGFVTVYHIFYGDFIRNDSDWQWLCVGMGLMFFLLLCLFKSDDEKK